MIKDSGARRQFEDGAVRDIQEGKGRCDLMPLSEVGRFLNLFKEEPKNYNDILVQISEYQNTGVAVHLARAIKSFVPLSKWENEYEMFLDVAKHFEDGCIKYGERNWEKGIDTKCFIDSGVRHFLKYMAGHDDEPHDRAFVWNLICCIWTSKNLPKFESYGKASKK